MKLFYGLQRKISIASLILYAIGWAAFVVGFVRRMVKPTSAAPRWNNYPEMVAVVVGPLFLLFAFLHACLNGTPSALLGSLAAVTAVVFLVGLGNTSITSAQVLYQYNESDNSTTLGLSLPFMSTSLAGSLVCCVAIALLLSLWGYYWKQLDRLRKVNRRVQQREIFLHEEDDDGDEASTTSEMIAAPTLCAGYARKAAVCFIIVAGLGWGVMVGGHHQRITRIQQEGGYVDNVFYFDFGQWTAIVLTPIMLVFALIHAVAPGRVSSVMGVVLAILNGFVVTSVGYYLVHDVGGWLEQECGGGKNCNFTLPKSAAALSEIVGGFLFVFFWACCLGVWPFFCNTANIVPTERERSGSDRMVIPTGYTSNQERSLRKSHEDEDIEPLQV